MASTVSSQGRSPHSLYDFDSTGDTDESWQYIDYSSGPSAPASVGFLPSPASGSLAGFTVVNPAAASPAASSPFYLDLDQPAFSSTGLSDQSDVFAATSAPAVGGLISQDDLQFITPQQYLAIHDSVTDMGPFFDAFAPNTPLTGLETFQQPDPSLGIPQRFQSSADDPPWDPGNATEGQADDFLLTDDTSASSRHTSSSPYQSAQISPRPRSEPDDKQHSAIKKVRVGKVEKKKSDQAGKFVIVTPTSINAHAGRPNPFECFEEALRTTQRGRKGPLGNETKQNALQVRRLGACFCCHSRKVKCDKERPCKNCKKLMVQVPQVVCWQFQDFLTVLFPEFIRGHFRKDEMSKFINENIDGFTVNGVERPCEVELYSGPRFSTVLKLRAKFFTAKNPDVLQHWHMHVGQDRIDLQARGAAPIGIDLDNSALRDEMRKRAKEYIHALIKEPEYAEQLTDTFRHTQLPRQILKIVQNYATRSQSPIVRKALSIYVMHYVMTRHLCLTRQSIDNLQPSKMVPQNVPWVTPRVLNRQIKGVIDEFLLKEMQQLFDSFSKSLKPKSRREWAPCLAAFLVLCLFMEGVETASDSFVISQNEINLRNHYAPEFKREFALQLCREIENLPFKQFAYQFHQIYQTHSRDASAKSFNPLVDDSFLDQDGLDEPALELVRELRPLLQGEHRIEMDFLTMDPILPDRENHPYPRDVSLHYTGRLLSKFLLSFTDERYIFEEQF